MGYKAATLARARRVGMPVLPGFVVESAASVGHMRLGASALDVRGSGGARLAVASEPLAWSDRLVAAAAELAPSLVARSSSQLDARGEWSGAFSSYVGVTPKELPKAVVGCWASAFGVDALGRHAKASIPPGSQPLAVLVQPALDPIAGGAAEIDESGGIEVFGVAGNPAPMLQGWIKGMRAVRSLEGVWSGEQLIELIGSEALEAIAGSLATADRDLSLNRCEWALTDQIWVLQLSEVPRRDTPSPSIAVDVPADLLPTIRVLVSAPGAMGEALVLPWALGGIPEWDPSTGSAAAATMSEAVALSRELTAEVWGMAPDAAAAKASHCLATLRGPSPGEAMRAIAVLGMPNPHRVGLLLSMISGFNARLDAAGVIPSPDAGWHLSLDQMARGLLGRLPPTGRIGVGRWEPLVGAAVMTHGARHQGTPAAAGFGAGPRFRSRMESPPPRSVVTASMALPALSQLIWDSAALVTEAGSPASHLFESARSLGVPAVCGLDLGDDPNLIVAVDGHSGVVSTLIG